MANEVPEFEALRAIPDRANPSRLAYRQGQALYAQVVGDWGLRIGEDVRPLRPDVIARPAGNATRGEWAVYAIGQGLTLDDVDGMTRDQLRDRFPADEDSASAEQPAEPGGAPDGPVEDVLAWVGGDVDRAAVVLDAERSRDKPRAGVVGPLEKLTGQ